MNLRIFRIIDEMSIGFSTALEHLFTGIEQGMMMDFFLMSRKGSLAFLALDDNNGSTNG